MAKQAQPSQWPICKRCGKPRERHWSANFSDGPMVAGEILICPTAIYLPKQTRKYVRREHSNG